MKYEISDLAKGIVNLMLTVVIAILSIRFVLKLFAANSENGFVNWVYETSAEVLGPFRGIFMSPSLDGFVIDFTAIFAIMIYLIIGMLAFYLIELLTPRSGKAKKR